MHVAVLAFGFVALGLVMLWAGNSSQEVVQVEEMGGAVSRESATSLTTSVPSSVSQAGPGAVIEPAPSAAPGKAAARAPAPEISSETANMKAPDAQAIVPVVPSAASSAQSAGSATGRTRTASSARTAGVSQGLPESVLKSSSKPTVRRHREPLKPAPEHSDVIPNPYHD
jgi:hypothetical protein